jgi:release factor glutamine methyltransferase
MDALNWTANYFKQNGIATPRLDAEVLLAHVLGVERIALYTHFDQPLSEKERAQYRASIKRRINGEPVSYIRNKKEFWARSLYVDSRVLIPRPETETVVDTVKTRIGETSFTPNPKILDMGCGSGAIALALSSFLRGNFYLIDIDYDALAVAKINCETYASDALYFLACSHLFSALRREPFFDIIVSNPPYVAREDLEQLPDGIRNFEPFRALDGGERGLEILRELTAQVPAYLKEGGLFATEIAPDQDEAVASFMEKTGSYRDIQVTPDLAGHPRVVSAWRN